MSSRARWRQPAVVVIGVVAVALAALYLFRIGSDPPGLYDDEASIGYNAWTIAHYGTDQFGNHVPLFFIDFGDYKGPIATYLVAPFTWFMSGGAAVVRLPSVLAGIAIFLVAGRLAFLLTRSYRTALVAMVLTALQPWMFLQSHTMLEGNILMVLCVLLACWFIAETQASARPGRWWSAAGAALGVCVYTYSIGRLLALLVGAAALLSFLHAGRRLLLRFLFPIAAAYVILAAYILSNPSGLFQRFQGSGLFADHPSALTAVGRFFGNYVSYFSPGFLVISGDGSYRQTTGFGGVLLDASVPLMLIGLVRLATRWRQPYPRFILLAAILAPVPAALTLAAPHALRGAGLFPFLVVMMIEGMAWVAALLRGRTAVIAALAAAAVLSATPFFVDFFTAYPERAALAFEAGEADALRLAYTEAGEGRDALFLSVSLNQPALQLMYAVSAPPPQDDFLRQARVTVLGSRAQLASAVHGDVLVLGPGDVPPSGATLSFVVHGGVIERAPVTPSANDLLRVYVI